MGLPISRRAVQVTALTSACAAAALTVAVAVWPASTNTHGATTTQNAPAPLPSKNIAQNMRACLLTDGSTQGQQLWAALQRLAPSTNVNVQQSMQPPESNGDASYINSLIGQKCNLVFATGAGPVSAVPAVAKTHSDVLFATYERANSTSANVIQLTADHDIDSEVALLIKQVKDRGRP